MNLMSTIKNLHKVNEDTAMQNEIDEAIKFQAGLVKKALAIAKKSAGNFDKAWAQIEKIKKGLAEFGVVANALKTANEGFERNSDLDSLFEESLDEGKKVLAKKGDYVFGKDTSKDTNFVTYKGKEISTGDFDQGADSWFMSIKGKKGQMSFSDADDVIKYFAKKRITESTETDLDSLFEEALSEGCACEREKEAYETAKEQEKPNAGQLKDKLDACNKREADNQQNESVELDEINNGLGSFVSQMKLLLKDPKAKKAHNAASSLIMRAQEKGAMAKTAISAIKKALPGLAKKAGGKWEKKIIGMKTMLIESVELEEAKVSLEKSGGYEVYTSGKSSQGVMLFLGYKGKIIASGSRKDGQFVVGFKHKDIHPNARYQPQGMVTKGKDFTHMGFDTAKEVIAFAKTHKITEDIKLDEVSRREIV